MIGKRFWQLSQLLTLSLSTLGACWAAQPQPFRADYKAQFNDITVTATRSLTPLEGGEQLFSFKAETWLATLLESSQFRWSEDSTLVPQKYHYQRSVFGKKRKAILNFNWQKMTVVNNVQEHSWSMSIPLMVQDKLSYQLQLRSDLLNNKSSLKYHIADGGHLKTYLFETMGEEVLNTPVGPLHTIKIKKVNAKGKRRTTYIWMAKNWDFLLVKLQQTERDGKTYSIHLLNAEIAGQQVKPSDLPFQIETPIVTPAEPSRSIVIQNNQDINPISPKSSKVSAATQKRAAGTVSLNDIKEGSTP